MLSSLFYVKNKDTYPPFKNGLYLEEYFHKYIQNNSKIQCKRTYIPVLWTNFQIEGWFNSKKGEMQGQMDEFIKQNPNDNGYYTVVQYDDGPLLKLPENTLIFGACSGTNHLPLIYQDINNTLMNIPRKKFQEKNILCSFVGTLTHTTRNTIYNYFNHNKIFKMINSGGWTPNVNKSNQDTFINTTINSKFALAPRGYGRSSFRFFEIFKLGTIPIYIWDDIEWLPYQDILDYSKFCISLHISKINELENILLNINENQYNNMLEEYNRIRDKFELEYMCEYIINTSNRI